MESQLVNVTEDILYVMDHKLQTNVMLLDFQKAFDIASSTPATSIQIIILSYFWINPWLTQRKQQVVLGGSTSV